MGCGGGGWGWGVVVIDFVTNATKPKHLLQKLDRYVESCYIGQTFYCGEISSKKVLETHP